MKSQLEPSIYENIRTILTEARSKAYLVINKAMVEAYWNIGKIVCEAQGSNERAEYGEYLIQNLSKKLTLEFGKGFTPTNLKYMRQFYLTFPIGHALSDRLSWTHYRLLMKVEKDDVRQFYLEECVKNQWSTRQLER